MAHSTPAKFVVCVLSVFGGMLLLNFLKPTKSGFDAMNGLYRVDFTENYTLDEKKCGAEHYVPREEPRSKISESALPFQMENADRDSKIDRQAVRRRLASVIDARIRRALQHTKILTNTSSTPLSSPSVFLSFFQGSGRLGNFMFMVASTVGIARATGRTASLQFSDKRTAFFLGLDLPVLDTKNGTSGSRTTQSAVELAAGIYTPELLRLNRNFSQENVTVHGYQQSWKYFHHIRNSIRAMFTFKKRILWTAQKVIACMVENMPAEIWSRGKRPLLAGIHVRRGDIVTTAAIENGYVPATTEYIHRMVHLVERKHAPVIFVVVSDDREYCGKIFKAENILCAKKNRPEVDMAIISLMEVVIMSVGTFGWWGAYLSDAKDVYYYKDWPRNGSRLQREVIHSDYFLSSWQGEN